MIVAVQPVLGKRSSGSNLEVGVVVRSLSTPMLFYFTFRVISAVGAFLYPGYASYKTLSQRPASEVELERWLMYWSVLGCIVGVEYVAEWLISWIPFYQPLKTLFLLYLALPQTSGASYIYKTHVQPFFASHETEIDSALSQLKTVVYQYLQRLLRSAWGHVASTMGQAPPSDRPSALDEGGITGAAAVNVGAPPTLGDPVSGPVQLAQTFWRSFGPGILANGAGLFQQAQRSAPPAPSAIDTPPPSRRAPARADTTQSMLERKRQLEAELASLANVEGYDVGPSPPSPVLIPKAGESSRRSSSSSIRGRGNNRSTFEEVEVPSDMEGEGHPVPQRAQETRRSSWFWGGSSNKGYERVKTD